MVLNITLPVEWNVSVPLWGLFNLTSAVKETKVSKDSLEFPSPYGDYLI